MLSPLKPRDGSPSEKARYKADCARKKKSPRDYGIIRRVPTAIAALGRKTSELYLKAEAAQPPGKGGESSAADQAKIKKLDADLEATRSHAKDDKAKIQKLTAELAGLKKQPPGKGGKSSAADQAKIKKLDADLEATRSHAKAMEQQNDSLNRHFIINRAIAKMFYNGEGFGADGRPDVARLEAITGLKDISAIERDILWKDISEAAA